MRAEQAMLGHHAACVSKTEFICRENRLETNWMTEKESEKVTEKEKQKKERKEKREGETQG